MKLANSMEMQQCILVVLMFVTIESNDSHNILTSQFNKIYKALEGPAGFTIKSKIYKWIQQSYKFEPTTDNYDDYRKCHPRLLQIMTDDLRQTSFF